MAVDTARVLGSPNSTGRINGSLFWSRQTTRFEQQQVIVSGVCVTIETKSGRIIAARTEELTKGEPVLPLLVNRR